MKTQNGKQVSAKVVGWNTFGRYKKISSEATYNMFVTDGWLTSLFGWKRVGEWADSNSKGRGAFKSIRNNIIVAVIGSAVIKIDSNNVASFVGNLSTSVGSLSFAENLNNQVCIVDGVSAYIYNVNQNSLTKQEQITSFTPNYVDYQNTYFLFGNGDFTSNGAKWFVYEYDTDTTIKYFAECALQTKSDHAIAVKRIPGGGNNVLVFGEAVTEIQTNVGGTLVYQRNSSMSIDFGCASVATIAGSDKIVCWLGVNESNPTVIMMFGPGGSRTISSKKLDGSPRTDGINYLLQSIQNPQDSLAYFYQEDGHLFYVLTFYHSDDNISIAYDFASDGFVYLTDYNMNFFPPVGIVYFNNKNYFLSKNNGSIYQISTKLPTYNENIDTDNDLINYEIPRVRVCDNIRIPDSSQFRANMVRLTMENGQDDAASILSLSQFYEYITDENGEILVTEDNEPIVTEDSFTVLPYRPKVDMAYSIDGGHTWSMYVSQYLREEAYRQSIVQWNKLGGMNDLVLKFRFWGKCNFVVNNAVVEVH